VINVLVLYVFKIHFNIILPSTVMFPKWSVPFRFPDNIFLWISYRSHACYMPCPSNPSQLLFSNTSNLQIVPPHNDQTSGAYSVGHLIHKNTTIAQFITIIKLNTHVVYHASITVVCLFSVWYLHSIGAVVFDHAKCLWNVFHIYTWLYWLAFLCMDFVTQVILSL